MKTDICHYATEKVSSKRTHPKTVDLTIDTIRIFLSDALARELILEIAVALATPFKEEKDEGEAADA